MDTLWEFVRSMTFWNWLSLIAFLFLPFSALNSILSLRSRWNDWRGVQSKKSYDSRLVELENLIKLVGEYRKEPTTFFLELTNKALFVMSLCLVSLFCFVLAFATRVGMFTYGDAFAKVFLWVGFMVLSYVFGRLLRIWTQSKYVAYPELLRTKVLNFFKQGEDKGWLTPEKAGTMVGILHENNFITETDKLMALRVWVDKEVKLS